MGAAPGISAIAFHTVDGCHNYAFGLWKGGGCVIKIDYVGHSVLQVIISNIL